MATIDLSYVKNLFSAGYSHEGDPEAYRELMIMILARATDADCYAHPAELDTVRRVVKEHLDEDLSNDDITAVSQSDLYNDAPLEKYITRLAPRLSSQQRKDIVGALIQVLQSDGQVAASEAEYFNSVVHSLRMTHSEVAGLV